MKFLKTGILLLSLIFLFNCKQKQVATIKGLADISTKIETPKKAAFLPNKQFNDYWYNGEAEITSYKLEMARYGEIRNGKAVLIYVTEPFLAKEQVKADRNDPKNVNILKLNSTKNFNTGVYPYSIMQSTFYPIANNQHAVKVSASVQEWCGHVYTQLNNRAEFKITSHSYFEGEADQNFSLKKSVLENEIWTQLRIDPNSLPTGDFSIIPSLEFVRLKHKPLKSYNAFAESKPGQYTLNIKELNRKLVINYNKDFPFTIENWEDTQNGLTSKATKLETIKSAYWSKKSNANSDLRKTLQLD